MKADILDKAFDNLFQMSDRPLTKNDFMAWLSEVRKLEAEPIEERPEWERKLEDEQDRLLRCGGIPLMASRNIINFIRTEIIEKICEEIRAEVIIAEQACGWTPKTRELVDAIKARWLGGSK